MPMPHVLCVTTGFRYYNNRKKEPCQYENFMKYLTGGRGQEKHDT